MYKAAAKQSIFFSPVTPAGVLRLFAIILPLLLPLLSGCGSSGGNPPAAVGGIIDLREWDFEQNGALFLNGDYEFYWERFLSERPSHSVNAPHPDGFRYVPDIWNKEGKTGHHDRYGYASYRLRIQLPKECPQLTFRFQDVGTACRIFANGREIYAAGHPGKTAETSIPAYQPALVDFLADSDEIDLIVQVANFYHRDGGLWLPIELGREADIRSDNLWRMLIDIFLFAGIFVIGCYYFGTFLIRRKELSFLYFAIFCEVVAIRSLVSGNKIIAQLFPDISWGWLVKLDYIGFGLSIPVFALFLGSLFRKDFPPVAKTIVITIGFTFSLMAALLPVSTSSQILPLYQMFMIACFTLGLYVLLKAIIHQVEGSRILFFGYIAIFMTAMNDVLQLYGVVPANNLIMLGLFLFIITQAAFLAIRSTHAFAMLEEHRAELAITNLNYRRELSERKHAELINHELQEKLTRSKKMEALGLLAGVVAHDLNNVLHAMVGYPDFLLLDLPEDSPIREPILTIRDSGIKAAAIVQDLLTLARRNVISLKPVNLNDIINDYFKSPEFRDLQTQHPHIQFETQLGEDLLNILGSSLHLRKALMNLITNAAEAHEEDGKVVITTENIYLDSTRAGYQDIEKGSYCLCKIEDQGIGISAEDLPHIFEPFYTKKNMGRSGTGLGMAVVWGTMQDHQGYVDVHSVEGQGTRFDLYIRTTTKRVTKSDKKIPITNYMGSGEKILVIDDVEEQREIACKILERLGYQVTPLESGEAAVEYCKANQADLLILDMIMDPGMDGLETYRQILQFQPQQQAIIASGFSETERVKEAQDSGAGAYLKKPYTIEKIGIAVKRELSKHTAVKSKK